MIDVFSAKVLITKGKLADIIAVSGKSIRWNLNFVMKDGEVYKIDTEAVFPQKQ